MSKPKAVQDWEARQDAGLIGPTKKLKDVPLDLIQFESLGLGTLPTPVGNGLNEYAYGFSEIEPKLRARLATAERDVEVAKDKQKQADAKAVAKVIAGGPEKFADLATALDDIDLVANAEAEHAVTVRAYRAAVASNKGTIRYVNGLVGGEYRDEMLARLAKAWATFVNVSTDESTTLGELARLEGVSTEARAILSRLVMYVEAQNRATGFNAADQKRLRKALAEDRDALPTIEILDDELAADMTAETEAVEVEKRRTEEERRLDIEDATRNAVARQRALHGDEPKNSGEASEEVLSE